MTQEGMDVERVAALAHRLAAQADAINAVVGVVDGVVASLANLWFGESFTQFHGSWVSGQRGQAASAADDIGEVVKSLGYQVQQQVDASGGSLASGGASVGWMGITDAAQEGWDPFREAWEMTGIVRSVEGVVEGLTRVNMDSRFGDFIGDDWLEDAIVPSALLRAVSTSLGVIDVGMSTAMVVDGILHGNQSETVMGGISTTLALGMMSRIPVVQELAIAGTAAELYGQLMLPTSQQGYDGTYDYALQQAFGSAYVPGHPTASQVAYMQQRYSGPLGPLNVVGDGIGYQMRWLNEPAQKAGQEFGNAVRADVPRVVKTVQDVVNTVGNDSEKAGQEFANAVRTDAYNVGGWLASL